MSPPTPIPEARTASCSSTLVASVLLMIGMAATLTLVDTASSTTQTTRAREQGTNLLRELIEAGRSVPCDKLTPTASGWR